MHFLTTIILVLAETLTAPIVIQAATDGSMAHDPTRTNVCHIALLVFLIAYLVVMAEEFTHLRKSQRTSNQDAEIIGDISLISMQGKPFDIFRCMARAEWDTLLFFYGVVLCVGGLGFIGCLGLLSGIIYVDMGPTFANASVGIISATWTTYR